MSAINNIKPIRSLLTVIAFSVMLSTFYRIKRDYNRSSNFGIRYFQSTPTNYKWSFIANKSHRELPNFRWEKSTSCKTNIKWVTAIFVASDGFIVPFISDTLSCASFIGWLTDCCSRLASRQNDSWLTDLQRCATFTPLTPRPSGPSWFFTQLIDCWVVIVDKDTFYSCINSTCVKYNFQHLSGITFWFQEMTFIFKFNFTSNIHNYNHLVHQ